MRQVHPKLHFRRFEIKYVLPKHVALAFKNMIRPYIKSDPFSGPESEYEVRSVYYDSPRFYYYHQKVDGFITRKKIRTRTYHSGEKFIGQVFLEIKKKFGDVILKDRFVLSGEQYEKFKLENDLHDIIDKSDPNALSISDQFEFEKGVRGISPKVLVTYIREPYEGLFDNNLRITFDRNIRVVENDNLYYEGNDFTVVRSNERELNSDGYVVVELKFRRGLPSYVSDAIRVLGLQRVSFSKYCLGVETCGSLYRLKSVQY